MRKATILIVAALLLVFCAIPVYASDLPPLPHAFCGNVTIGGNPAPVNTTTVEARGKGVITGIEGNPITVTEAGKYGSPEPLGQKLIVKGDITNGTEISFLVNGTYTGTTFDFKSGETTVLDLDLAITDTSITGEVKETIPSNQTNYVVNASTIANTTITVSTTAVVTITVEKYLSNPHPTVTPPASMLPRFIDIKVDNPGAVRWPMYVKQTYTHAEIAGLVESSLGMYYFKATDNAWHRCSDTGVNTDINFIWANMIRGEVSGSPVAIGGTAAPAPAVGVPGTVITTVSLTGLISTPSLQVDANGIVQSTCQLKTTDGKLTLDIAKGAKLLDSQGNPLASLSAALEPSPLAPPSGKAIILAYNLGPDRATFSPSITLTIRYDPTKLPEGITEDDLYIAYWDGSKWLALTTTVNAEADTVSCKLSHFTTFAVIGAVMPEEEEVVPPEEEVVPPEEEVVPPEEEVVPPEEEEEVPEVPAKPLNWPLIGGIIGGVVVVGLLIFFLVFRRRAY